MDFVEPARGDEPFEGDEDEDGENVEGWLVSEDGVAFDALECQDGMPELDFCECVADDGAEGVGQHGDEDGEE